MCQPITTPKSSKLFWAQHLRPASFVSIRFGRIDSIRFLLLTVIAFSCASFPTQSKTVHANLLVMGGGPFLGPVWRGKLQELLSALGPGQIVLVVGDNPSDVCAYSSNLVQVGHPTGADWFADDTGAGKYDSSTGDWMFESSIGNQGFRSATGSDWNLGQWAGWMLTRQIGHDGFAEYEGTSAFGSDKGGSSLSSMTGADGHHSSLGESDMRNADGSSKFAGAKSGSRYATSTGGSAFITGAGEEGAGADAGRSRFLATTGDECFYLSKGGESISSSQQGDGFSTSSGEYRFASGSGGRHVRGQGGADALTSGTGSGTTKCPHNTILLTLEEAGIHLAIRSRIRMASKMQFAVLVRQPNGLVLQTGESWSSGRTNSLLFIEGIPSSESVEISPLIIMR